MSNRKLSAAILLALLPLTLVACGDDKADTPTTTTTAKPKASTTTEATDTTGDDVTDSTDTTETTEKEISFSEGVAKGEDMLASAKDVCDVWNINDYLTNVGQPDGVEDVKAAVGLQAKLWGKMADTAPDDLSAEAKVFRSLADSFDKDAAAVGYDFNKITELPSLSSKEFQDAQQKYAAEVGGQCSEDK
jgi:hypothetical protein